MSENADSLDDLLRPVARQRTPRRPAPRRGLSPAELLELPKSERELLTWLSRERYAGAEAIRAALGWSVEQTEATLATLRARHAVHQALLDGQPVYRVVFSGVSGRGRRSLPRELLATIDQDAAAVLRQTAIFAELEDDPLQRLAARAETWHYNRNDVILWQGDQNDRLFIIKSGMAGVLRLAASAPPRVIAYLKQHDIFGETGAILEQSRAATATVTALSELEVLAIRHQDLRELLLSHAGLAMGMARLLAQRLSATNERLQRSGTQTQVALVFGVQPGVGATTLGLVLAGTLGRATNHPAVYAEFPRAAALRALLPPDAGDLTSSGGPDLYAPAIEPPLPSAARATLLFDLLAARYRNIVVGLPGALDEAAGYLLEHADQAVVVAAPGPAEGQAMQLLAQLRSRARPEQTGLLLVHSCPWPGAREDAGEADFVIPHIPEMPDPLALCAGAVPEPLAEAAAALADRLGRTQQVSVFIPTTVDVDQAIDTRPYVERTLALLGRLFGGATSSQAQGVWSSDSAGLVNETIFVVRSYVTQADLDRHLPEVLGFVEGLKAELRQEAMAVEVNQRLMLI